MIVALAGGVGGARLANGLAGILAPGELVVAVNIGDDFEHNHNVAICGKSGSGKSVLLQEMCAALRGAGAKVVVINDGRSFEHSVKLQGGRFVEFTISAGFCLNPFSMIDAARAAEDEDYRLDCFAMIKAIVAQMARHSAPLSDTERGMINKAVNLVWGARGPNATITLVGEALVAYGNETGTDLATALAPYMAGGTYAAFFDLIVFAPPRSALVVRHFGARPQPFAKRVLGVAGDRVTEKNRVFFVNGKPVALAKVISRLGEPLTLGPTGTIPMGCYFVATDHKDGFDSRYAAIGWICRPQVLGVGMAVL